MKAAQALRGLREIQQFGHGHEVAEMSQFHARTMPESYRCARNKVLGVVRQGGLQEKRDFAGNDPA
jgi:hypothetical protein